MLRSLSKLEGYELLADDGDIGRCSDFLIDDEQWGVRYMVADTGHWLPGRKVLVTPAFMKQPRWETREIPVRLTTQQIEQSPPLDDEAPVSRRYEQAYHDFFATSYYWMSGEIWGTAANPAMPIPPPPQSTDLPEPPEEDLEQTHLRSVNELLKYNLEAVDGAAGHAHDFIVDDERWVARYLVLDTSRLPFSKKLLIAIDWISEVSWVDRQIKLNVTTTRLEGAPEFDPSAAINPEQEVVLYDYYGRPRAHRSEVK